MLSGWREATARRPWRISAKLLIISSVVTVIGFSAICVNVMLDMRRGEEALARQTLENLATSIDADISRNIDIYDLSLKAVASNMLLPEINTVSKPIRQLILFDHATTAKHFGAIQVFDADGNLTIDASTLDPVPENRGNEEYFTVHRDDPNAGLFISRPMLFRGAYSIVLSRRRQRYRRRLHGGRRRLDPLHLFPRIVRAAEPRPRGHHHRAQARPHHHDAAAVRSRHHRQEPGNAAGVEARQSQGRRILRWTGAGGRDAAALRAQQRLRSAVCRGGQTAPVPCSNSGRRKPIASARWCWR